VSGLIFAVVVVLVVISRIRKLAGEYQSGEGAERVRVVRTRLASASTQDDNFSLQQVLAEIQKVKDEAQRQPGTAAVSRQQMRARLETSRRDRPQSARTLEKWRSLGRDPSEEGEAAGPMGRPSTRSISPAEEVDEGQDVEHPAGFQTLATKAGAPERAVADQTAPTSQAPTGPAPRFKLAELRNALVWREILGLPVSLRDE
jgi:hypothetical protein